MLNPVLKSRYPLLFGVDVLCGLVPVVGFVLAVILAVAQHHEAVGVKLLLLPLLLLSSSLESFFNLLSRNTRRDTEALDSESTRIKVARLKNK